MNIELINNKIKESMVKKDQSSLEALRGFKTLIVNEQKANGNTELTDVQLMAVLQRTIKQRRDSIQMFEKAGRSELVDREKSQLNVLLEFLPTQLTDEDLLDRIGRVIGESKNVGMVMGAFNKAYPEIKGQYDSVRLKDLITKLV